MTYKVFGGTLNLTQSILATRPSSGQPKLLVSWKFQTFKFIKALWNVNVRQQMP